MERKTASCPECGQKYYAEYGPSCDCKKPVKVVSCPICGKEYDEADGPSCKCEEQVVWKGLRLCRYCGEPMKPHSTPAMQYDPEHCERININDTCPFIGIRCRDVAYRGVFCHKLTPDPSWADEIKKQKTTDKFTVEGKTNRRKLNHSLKQLGISPSHPSRTRRDAARKRFFFLMDYCKEARPDKEFCSDECRRKHYLDSQE